VTEPDPLAAPTEKHEKQDGLLLDEIAERFERFRILRNNDQDTDAILEEVGARGEREARIVNEVTMQAPLAFPHRFEAAHRLMIRSLEVLDRNGFRSPSVPKLGPLYPVARYAVELMARYIVRSHQANLIDNMRHLYGRREARARRDDPVRRSLAHARVETERLAPGFKGNPLGIPGVFIGLLIPLFAAGSQSVSRFLGAGTNVIVILSVVGFLLFGALAWVFLRGAAVARRRIHLTVDEPARALWETIGGAGGPPSDDSRMIALVAIVLTSIGWLIVPITLAVVLWH
jgi:hypothetical protein